MSRRGKVCWSSVFPFRVVLLFLYLFFNTYWFVLALNVWVYPKKSHLIVPIGFQWCCFGACCLFCILIISAVRVVSLIFLALCPWHECHSFDYFCRFSVVWLISLCFLFLGESMDRDSESDLQCSLHWVVLLILVAVFQYVLNCADLACCCGPPFRLFSWFW